MDLANAGSHNGPKLGKTVLQINIYSRWENAIQHAKERETDLKSPKTLAISLAHPDVQDAPPITCYPWQPGMMGSVTRHFQRAPGWLAGGLAGWRAGGRAGVEKFFKKKESRFS